MSLEKIAVIDIGSNSVRFMIYSDENIINNKQICSTVLADGLNKTGLLNSDAMARTTNAVCAFTSTAKQLGAEQIFVFATEAVRAAKNGIEFTNKLQDKCGVPVDVINGALEARIGFMGACSQTSNTATVIDIGGASVEIISGENGNITYSKSLPLGMVRLIDILGNNRQNIHAYLQQKVTDYGETKCQKNIIGIGGTATSLGAINLNLKSYDAQKVNGAKVSLDDLKRLEDIIYSSSNVCQTFPVLSVNRARIIGHGVITMQHILQYLKADSFIVSENDNMEGYIMYKKNV